MRRRGNKEEEEICRRRTKQEDIKLHMNNHVHRALLQDRKGKEREREKYSVH